MNIGYDNYIKRCSARIDGRDYSVVGYHACRCGHIFKLYDPDASDSRYRMLKLIDERRLERRAAEEWANSMAIEHDRLSAESNCFDELRARGIRFPQVFSCAHSIYCEYLDVVFPHGLLVEYIRGSTLAEVMNHHNRDGIDRAGLVAICHDLIRTVQYMNSTHRFYHLDIAASNIIIDEDGNGWLVDFTGALCLFDLSTIAYRQVVSTLVNTWLASRHTFKKKQEIELQQGMMIINLLSGHFWDERECRAAASQIAQASEPLDALTLHLEGSADY